MIDHERLATMEADFGAEELALIIAAFRAEAADALAGLRAGWMNATIRRERLHFLKGSARTIGATRLGDLCEAFELGAPDPDAYHLLEHEFASVCKALDTGCFRAPSKNDALSEPAEP